MSESTSEEFSDDSDCEGVSQDEKPTTTAENGKRKVTQNKSEAVETDSSDEGDKPEIDLQPVKKRKTLQDYLNEKVFFLDKSKNLT